MSEYRGTSLHLKAWDGSAYKKEYYDAPNPESEFFMTQFFKHFSKCSELLKRAPSERQIIEVGAGPCVCYVACAVAAGYSPITKSNTKLITICDLMEDNKLMITKWMEKAPDAVDWTSHLNYISNLSGKSVSDIEANLRSAFKEALIYDVTAPDIPIPGMESKYDIVMTNLCLEACCVTMEDWTIGIRNMIKLLKPGGILIEGGMRNLGHAVIGGVKFPTLRITKDGVHKAYSEADNLELLEEHWQDIDFEETNDCTHDGMFSLIFKKTK